MAWKSNLLLRHALVAQRRVGRLPPNVRSVLWSLAAGLLLMAMNTAMRQMALELAPLQTFFLRYACGLAVMLPLVLRAGVASYGSRVVPGHFGRGLIHSIGLCMWFVALPHLTIADTTAITFTTPIFVMIGAVLFFHERLRWERCVAVAAGFAGVLLVVLPKLSGQGGGYALLMLASAPVFAASFMLTKVLTRSERSEVIVFWQGVAITLFSLPLAVWQWHPVTPSQWLVFAACGVLGTAGQICLTRSVALGDLSVSQSTRFVDLVWAALLGWIVFGDVTSESTLLGGAVICAATVWILHRESRWARS